MAIATLLIATLILNFVGTNGVAGMSAAIAIGSVICIVSAISGDTSQDLKTGFILGSTPKKQQIGEIIGVVCAALAIGGTLYLLDYAWGFGSEALAAPQATLMKMIVEGVMNAQLPWNLVLIGVFIAVIDSARSESDKHLGYGNYQSAVGGGDGRSDYGVGIHHRADAVQGGLNDVVQFVLAHFATSFRIIVFLAHSPFFLS